MKPRCGSVLSSVTRRRSPTSRPCSPRISRPSTGGSRTRTNTPLGVTPVTTAGEGLAHAVAQRHRGHALVHVALHFARGVLLQRAVARDGVQFLVGIRRPAPGRERLEQPLRHQVGEAAIGRGGVRVIVRRQAEVALLGVAGPHRARTRPAPSVSAPTAKHRGSAPGRPALRRMRNAFSAPGSGSRGSFSPYCAASSTMRGQRSGAFTTRRMEETPAPRSVRAITSLAPIMKSSISCAARLWPRAVISTTSPSVMTGCASWRSKVSAPSRWRALAQRLRRLRPAA